MGAPFLMVFAIGSLFFAPLQAQVNRDLNQKASYPAGPAVQRTITRTFDFTYTERNFIPPFRIGLETSTSSLVDTPEHAMATRARAMAASEYDKWLATWDGEAKSQFAEEYQVPAKLGEQKRLWHAVFSVGQIVLFKRIETRQFVILTYRVLDQKGTNIGRLELPSVFRKVDGGWLGTQELSADPLLEESPWMTGQSSAQKEVR
jgi:hypothetical protein